MSPKRKPCRPSSCLEPGAWASWLLRGPWPARSEKRARLFPLLQPATIVKKVNTPHSLTSKSSSQEWEEIKNLPQLSRRGPTGLICAAGTPLGTQKERQFWSRTSTLSLWGPQPLSPPSSGQGPLPASAALRKVRCSRIGDSGVRQPSAQSSRPPPLHCGSAPRGPFADSVSASSL